MLCSSGREGVGYEGDTCSFTCNTGYNLTGNDTKTCQSDGRWSGSNQTLCIFIDQDGSSNMITTIVIVAGASLLLSLIVAGVIVILFIRKKRATKNKGNYLQYVFVFYEYVLSTSEEILYLSKDQTVMKQGSRAPAAIPSAILH